MKKMNILFFLLILTMVSFGETKYDEPIWQVVFIFQNDEPVSQNTDEELAKLNKEKFEKKYDSYKKELKKKLIEENGIKNYLTKNYSDKEEINSKFMELYKIYPENLKYYEEDLDETEIEKKKNLFYILNNSENYETGKTVSVMYDNKEHYYKDLYFLTKILVETQDLNWVENIIYVNNVVQKRMKLWNDYYQNVRRQQFIWEEWVNMSKAGNFLINKEKQKDDNDYIKKVPNPNQWVILHPSVMIDINEKEFRPSIGLEIIGVTFYDVGSGYEKSKGLSMLVSINDKEEDSLGIGIIGNWNDKKMGVIYRERDNDEPKWWLTGSINIARLFPKNDLIEIDEKAVKSELREEGKIE